MQASFTLKLEELTPDFLEQLKGLFSDAKTGVHIEVNSSVLVPAVASLEVMNEDLFWHLIGKLEGEKETREEVIAPLIAALSKRSLADIYQFEEILTDKLFQLDSKQYAEQIGESAYQEGKYFSVDSFLYARCTVVACGKVLFHQVLTNPQKMPKDAELEALLYVAEKAYELKTGKTDYSYFPQKSYETYSNHIAWGKTEENAETLTL